MCYFVQVDDIKAAMKDLKEHNIRALNPEPKVIMIYNLYKSRLVNNGPDNFQSLGVTEDF